MKWKVTSLVHVSIPVALISLFVLFPPLDLQAQPKNHGMGMTVQNPKRQMVMITPAMLQQPEHYDIRLYETVSPSRVVLSLYHHTGIKISERAVELPAATDKISLDKFLDPAAHFPVGYYYYQIEQDAPQRSHPQTDSLLFSNVSNTHLPVDSTFGGYAEFADVNGDSTLDIITGIDEFFTFNPPRLLINDGSGHFIDQSAQRLPQIGLFVNDMAVFDADLDGDLDFYFVAQDAQSQIESTDRLYLNDGNGNFSDVSSTHLPTLPVASRNVEWGLINEDSFPDLVVTSFALSAVSTQTQTPLSVLINDGTGRFVDRSSQYLPETLYGALDATLADVNKDLRNDIILANFEMEVTDAVGNILFTFSGQNAVFIQTNEGTFVDETTARMPDVVNPSKLIKVTDINNDDAPDLYAINLPFSSSVVRHELYLNDGTGSFQEVAAQRLPLQLLTNINDVEFRDFDGDGDVDLYIVNTILGGSASDFLNLNEDGFFRDASEGLPVLEDFGISTSSGDIDQDGDYDLFVSVADGQAGLRGFDKLLENISPMTTASEPTPSFNRQHFLSQNHPNPVTSSTRISYAIRNPGFVTMRLFDVRGKEIQTLINAFHNTGNYSVDFVADKLPSGLYFYRLEVDNRMVETKKMVRIR